MSSCPTCLGLLQSSHNLREPTSSKLLELLQHLLGFQIEAKEEKFLVCSKCVEKLTWISEFQESCQKNYVLLRVTKCKEEIIDPEFAQLIETLDPDDKDLDKDLGFEPHNDDSETSYNVDTSNMCKKEKKARETSKKTKVRKTLDNGTSYTRKRHGSDVVYIQKRRNAFQQFPKEDVLKGIAECRNYMTDIKNKKCIYCDFVVPVPKAMALHMRGKHSASYNTWCSRCNIQTDNLQDHLKATNCTKKICKFCQGKFKKTAQLTRHMLAHCRETLDPAEEEDSDCSSNADIGKKRKKKDQNTLSDTTKIPKAVKALENSVIKEPLRMVGLIQFPKEDVLKAVAECTNYMYGIKYRTCIHCNEVASAPRYLTVHMTSHHGDSYETWCSRCNLQTDNLPVHLEATKCSTMDCKFCKKPFKKMSNLRRHLESHCKITLDSDEEDFEPRSGGSDCSDKVDDDKKCKRKKQLRISDTTKGSQEDKAFDNSGDIKASVQILRCQQFPKADVLKAIAECTNYMSGMKNRTCLHCEEVTLGPRYLTLHMTTYHREFIETWCRRCNLQTDNLQSHMETTNCSQYLCKFCEKAFNRISHLRRHLDSHCRISMDGADEDFEARSDSDSSYNVNDGKEPKRKEHIRSCKKKKQLHYSKNMKKSGGVTEPCVLLYGFVQFPKADVLKAIAECTNYMHGIKNRTCLHCEELTLGPRYLTLHMTTHHREFIETWCRRCNLQTVNLQAHMETTNCSEIICKFCQKAFNKNSHLRRHLDSHCRINLDPDDEDFQPRSGSDCSYNVNDNKKPKRKEQIRLCNRKKQLRHSKNTNKSTRGVTKRCVRKFGFAQFPKADVLKAIADSTNYIYDIKNRTCLHCDEVASAPRYMTLHMKANHLELLDTWCRRCNLQTDNLEAHKEAANCFENECKFCPKKFTKISQLTRHLHSHCNLLSRSEELTNVEDIDELLDTKNKTSSATSVQCKFEIDSNFDLLELEDQSESTKFEYVGFKQAEETLNSDTEECQSTEVSTNCTLQLFGHEEVLKAISASRRLFQTNWNCVLCDFPGSNTTELDNHMTVAHKEERHTWCRICNTIVDDLTRHRSDHRKNQFKCTFCEQGFGTINLLIYHLKRHSEVYKSGEQLIWFTCKVCLNFYPNAEQLEKHECTGKIVYRDETYKRVGGFSKASGKQSSSTRNVVAKRSNKKRVEGQFPPEEVKKAINDTFNSYKSSVKCILCDAEKVSSRMLSFHMAKVHWQVRGKWCNLCNTLVDDLSSHKKGHSNDLLKCKFCGASFAALRFLAKHMKLHARSMFDKETWYDCDICPNTYPDVHQLRDHECHGPDPHHNGKKIKIVSSIIETDGTGSDKYSCSFCRWNFSSYHTYGEHMLIHNRKKCIKNKCTYCGKQYENKQALIIHVRSHTGERPFLCNICGKGFMARGALQTHILTHSDRKIVCTICNKRFYLLSSLKTHMHLHTGERRYLCNICGLRFQYQGNLTQHMRRYHNYGKPYKCRFCEKEFKTCDLRTYHEDKHQGIKTLRCNKCRYTSKIPEKLAEHMKKHSATDSQREPRHKCLICHKQFSMKAMLTMHMNNQHDEIV